ncbi:MAG: TIM-barrel domain-containing protein [Terracidiphilus sp.]|jgi:alpha-D-xyloside xylohydrolase
MSFFTSAMRLGILSLALCAGVLPAVCQDNSREAKDTHAAAATTKIERIQNGVQLAAGDLNVKVQFYSEGTVRVVKWPAGGTPEKLSLSVIQKDLPKLDIQFAENKAEITLSSAQVKILVSKSDGSIQYLDGGGRTLLKESGPATFAPTHIEREEKAFSIRQNFMLSADEGVYGLGQQQLGVMNYRGHTVKIVQANTKAVTPVLVSTAGYGIFWDNYSKTIFDDTTGKTSFWSEVADNVDYYFFYGPSIDQEIAGYRQLTGQAPMYGKWAYGYWQSKEHYATRDELLGIAQEYRKRRIPIDNIVQDWDYWGNNDNWGGMVFDETKYPRPKEMVDELHAENFHLMISIWAGLGPSSDIYKEMDKRGYLFPTVGWAGFRYFDVYNPAATDLYWDYASKGLFSKGVDAWWMDSTEPDIVNALTQESEEFEMKREKDNHLGTFARYLNTYSLMDTEAVYSNQRKETDRKRVYILTRSTFAGQQRAAATTWSGDIGSSWDVYKRQIAAGLNHSMAGIPYWTFDIGAYSLGCQGGVFMNGGKDPAYQEFYTRMFQFGAFAPIFRSHGSETPREIYEFGEYVPVLEKFDNLRYRLLPYIYSLGWQVTSNGYSIMRGLPMDFAADHKTYSIDDQYMFGPAVMVSPVTEYMYHRPPENSTLVTAEHFRTADGKPGLRAQYFCDDEFKNLCHEDTEPDVDLYWYTGWASFIHNSKFSIRWEGKLIPTETGSYRFNLKSFGQRRVYLDGKELPHNYDSMESYTVPVELTAGKEYDFKFETTNASLGAFRAQLYWKTPSIHAKEAVIEPREKTRSVYLPAGTSWVDFWTGEKLDGGRTIVADAPIEKIPLMVRAGSIVPMGPFIQYSTEKPADPIELRIYPGADGSFTLYEDENDNYDYEKGVYATIAFHWDDAKRELTIDRRKGEFPGMLKTRLFDVVIVGKSHGTGVDAINNPDKVILYKGERETIQLPM